MGRAGELSRLRSLDGRGAGFSFFLPVLTANRIFPECGSWPLKSSLWNQAPDLTWRRPCECSQLLITEVLQFKDQG